MTDDLHGKAARVPEPDWGDRAALKNLLAACPRLPEELAGRWRLALA